MKLPRGTHIKPEKIENFFEICRQLDSDFTGALRLRGVREHRVYIADLLVDLGAVIGSSFKYMDSEDTLLRNEALEYIKNNLAGSSGKLDIFKFDSEEMRRGIESNADALLEDEVKVHDLGVKIKSTIVKKKPGVGLLDKISSFIKKPAPKRKEERVKEIKSFREGFRPQEERVDMDFGRQKKEEMLTEKETKNFRLPEVTPLSPPNSVPPQPTPSEEEQLTLPFGKPKPNERKKERLQKIKEARLQKISERISIEKEEKTVKKIVEGMKIKTTIDKLYELILDKGVIRINDELAKKLRVSKTQVEEWAMILEEHNLVELHYPAIGEPEVKKIHEKK